MQQPSSRLRDVSLLASLLGAVTLPAQAPRRAASDLAGSLSIPAALAAAAPDSLASRQLAVMAFAPATSDCASHPRNNVGRFVGGLVGAWVVGMVAFRAFDDPNGSDRRVKGDAGYTPNANTAFALGSWVGSATGVYLASNDRACGSLVKALLVTAIPSAPLLLGRNEPLLPFLGVVLGAPAQSLVATLSYPR